MDAEYTRSQGEYAIYQDLYQRAANTLKHVWDAFPSDCANTVLLIDEIIDNRFNRNPRTNNVRVRLECDHNGMGRVRIYNDGADYNDLTNAPKRPELVIDIIKRLQMEYSFGDGGEVPIVSGTYTCCRIVKFQFRK